MYLVHKGSGNNCIYASADAPWFTNGWGEPGGPRTTVDRPAAAVADGHLFIAHRGESNSRVYVKDVTADPSPFNWIDSGRDTPTGPSIAVLNSEVWIGHQGLDGRNYAARLGSASWPSLGESTSVEPFLVVFQGKVGYCYVLNDMMRIDWLP